VYLDAALLERCAVAAKVRSCFIAMHEHTDTFLDKLDTALMVRGEVYDSLLIVRGGVIACTSIPIHSSTSSILRSWYVARYTHGMWWMWW
jgi:hypothetical protein